MRILNERDAKSNYLCNGTDGAGGGGSLPTDFIT